MREARGARDSRGTEPEGGWAPTSSTDLAESQPVPRVSLTLTQTTGVLQKLTQQGLQEQ